MRAGAPSATMARPPPPSGEPGCCLPRNSACESTFPATAKGSPTLRPTRAAAVPRDRPARTRRARTAPTTIGSASRRGRRRPEGDQERELEGPVLGRDDGLALAGRVPGARVRAGARRRRPRRRSERQLGHPVGEVEPRHPTGEKDAACVPTSTNNCAALPRPGRAGRGGEEPAQGQRQRGRSGEGGVPSRAARG